MKHPQPCAEEHIVLFWLGKAQALVIINDRLSAGITHSKIWWSSFPLYNIGQEFCFFQFYDIIQADQLMVDKVDKAFNCRRVNKDRKEGVHSGLSSSEAYGFVLVDIISGKNPYDNCKCYDSSCRVWFSTKTKEGDRGAWQQSLDMGQ